VKGLAERSQSQRVGGGAIEDEEDIAISIEELAKSVGGQRGPGIFAVGGGTALVGALHCLPSLGTDARVVVAAKLLSQVFRMNFRRVIAHMVRIPLKGRNCLCGGDGHQGKRIISSFERARINPCPFKT